MSTNGPISRQARRIAEVARHPALAIAVGAALLSVAVLLVVQDLGQDEDPGSSDGSDGARSGVVVATERDLERGTSTDVALADGGLAIRDGVSSPPPGAVTSAAEVRGRILDTDVPEGELLLDSHLRDATVRELADVEIPDDMEAVAITLPFTAAGGGYAGVGDRLNIYAVLETPRTAFLVSTSIRVLDVSTELPPYTGTDPRPTAASITYLLAIPREQVPSVMLLDDVGQLKVAIVEPETEQPPEPLSTRLDALLAELTVRDPDLGASPTEAP